MAEQSTVIIIWQASDINNVNNDLYKIIGYIIHSMNMIKSSTEQVYSYGIC